MSILSILSTLFIGPLKLVFELIFGIANRFVSNPGLAIIFLSLAMNILVLPLYKRADAMQEAARDTEAKLKRGVDHIKKTFSGDERMMMLQAYYRQNDYKPTSSLNGSVSLLLEIPFFMAAYQFLSHLDLLNGVSFGPIADMGAPDGLIVIGGITLNLLPILMTTINVISSAIYLKGFPLKTKIQLYGIALFFLVFLWTSPAGLVFYWTLNNVFSLVKNIFYKIKNPQKVLRILTFIIGIAGVVFGAAFYDATVGKRVFIVLLGAALMLPMILNLVKSKVPKAEKKPTPKPNTGMFILGGVFMTVLVGVLIPSAYISASTLEYIDVTYFHNPMWYIASSTAMSAGFFLVWFGVFYWLANPAGKVFFTRLMWILSGVAITNYMFFGTKLGTISAQLQYDKGLSFSGKEHIINLLVVLAVTAVLLLIAVKWKKVCTTVLLTASVAVFGMAVLNMSTITSAVDSLTSAESLKSSGIPSFDLSTEGENVVVIMLDRAMGEYIPYIFAEKPELEEKFAGFTYYKNTISFAAKTNMAAPALLGGYEYTPVEMNKRDTESLVSKHNEALKVMPVLFAENGYEVTVCDPPYANYAWIPDLTIYDDYPEIDTYISKGVFGDTEQKQTAIDSNHRNFFCFGIMKSMPTLAQAFIYDNGTYNRLGSSSVIVEYAGQERVDLSHATGLDSIFMNTYNVLINMSQMTKISTDDKNTFLFLANDTTHDPMLLQTPDYVPSDIVDNEE
ncbi:MAG: YidC/Oxa1 family membrane protein insertase, partial [Clostridia bacterium]|nr:YidC/Oxa1 family membrane protein insertase [Clostridia bacterium]